ncbi:GL19926 [Drosophila persimilis]|uniref:RING-type E3 ubiquitin transferase n=1 Tax=Drosophila persimilis TaxID=7234 RepID=B4GYI2_DROPE|nr:E3 ubiquitin-protein ligase KCMF1 [Drosophila persimilis]EDW27838.1 GL19926 [Drosophila persimilis]
MSTAYWNVCCSGCRIQNLPRYRFKCLRCANYDLCEACHEKKVVTGVEHKPDHPFQCLVDLPTKELLFAGEPIPTLEADSFTCPVCSKHGHSADDLVKHTVNDHKTDSTKVICPLCVAVHGSDPHLLDNIGTHMSHIHGSADRTVRFDLPGNDEG